MTNRTGFTPTPEQALFPSGAKGTNARLVWGFTLLEVLITIALLVVVSLATLPNLHGKRGSTELTATAQRIVALLREAQSRALTGDSGVDWGVHLDNSSSSTPFYALFSSSSFATANVQSRGTLPAAVRYSTSDIPAGGAKDIVFSKITGRPAAGTSVTLEQMTGVDVVRSVTIAISAAGAVSF